MWTLLEPNLPVQRGQWGGIAQDNRRFINAVFSVLRTGAPWRDLPPITGNGAVFIRGSSAGAEKVFGKSFWKFWLMSRIMNGWWLTPAISRCIPTQRKQRVAIRICPGQKGAQHQNTSGRGCAWYASPNPLADRGYDTNGILAYAVSMGMEPVIPPKKNCKKQRSYGKYFYKLRHLVENSFLVPKRWRGIATRYAKTSGAFIAAVHVRCIAIWAAIQT